MKHRFRREVILLAVALSFLLVLAVGGCGSTGNRTGTLPGTEKDLSTSEPYSPVFTDPVAKLEALSGQEFTEQLYNEALAYEPLLGTAGAQVNMGFYSAKGNHGSLVRLLDAINDYKPPAGEAAQKAIWDEGATSSNQYPSYVTMLEEHWYDRSSPTDGKVTIYGVRYTDPHPVTFQQADDVWGAYSKRYTDMAGLIKEATGKAVRAWCYVEGAKANRIFYKYELPELVSLEQRGAVQVFFARSRDADWTEPADWIEGTSNAPQPAQ